MICDSYPHWVIYFQTLALNTSLNPQGLSFLFLKAWSGPDGQSQTHFRTKWPSLSGHQLALSIRQFCFAKKKKQQCVLPHVGWIKRESRVTWWVEEKHTKASGNRAFIVTVMLLCQLLATCSCCPTLWYFYKLFEETWNAILTFACWEGLFTMDAQTSHNIQQACDFIDAP